jgi:hypothetical protein
MTAVKLPLPEHPISVRIHLNPFSRHCYRKEDMG